MDTGDTNRIPLRIILLVLFSLAIILFFGVLINFLLNPPARPTITTVPVMFTITSKPSPSLTSTSTITLTPRPTVTLRPSETVTNTPTPTATLTPTLIRTITPAKPARLNIWYELKPWDLVQQARTLELLRANTILAPSADSFRTLAYGEGEAYLRFHEAVDAIRWRWDRAYNLIRIGDPQAMPLYAGLMKSAIDSGQVRSNDLPNWFSQYETRLTLQISILAPQPGELGRELIVITGEGSAYFWLIENPAGTSIYPLINDINFNQPHENDFRFDDLTGDGSAELVIFRRTSPNDTRLVPPHIFELSGSPLDELPILNQVPVDFGLDPRTEIETGTNATGEAFLRVTSILLTACPTYATQDYTWNGEIFTVSALQYELFPTSQLLAYCEIVLDEASASWGPEKTLAIIQPLLELWPPEADTQGRPYPIDAFDQLRYRLGVLYALAGQSSEAIRYLDSIINTPIVPDSTWITPSQQFLRVYQNPANLFSACQQAQFCNLRDALRTMVTTSAYDDLAQVFKFLQDNGVTIRSSGVFDFDMDRQDERWMIIQPKPEAKLEFWILSQMSSGVQAVFVQIFEGNESLPYYHQPAGSIPVVQLELHKGFVFNRLPNTKEAYIDWVDVEYARPKIILDGYNQALIALMDGTDPSAVRDAMLDLLNSPRFMGDCIAFRICDQFHYTLGLVYNLVGEFGNAIDQYLWVWRNYGQSPYSLLARLKLDYFPLPTYTQTTRPTNAPTLTRTVTQTVTPSPTKTETTTP